MISSTRDEIYWPLNLHSHIIGPFLLGAHNMPSLPCLHPPVIWSNPLKCFRPLLLRLRCCCSSIYILLHVYMQIACT